MVASFIKKLAVCPISKVYTFFQSDHKECNYASTHRLICTYERALISACVRLSASDKGLRRKKVLHYSAYFRVPGEIKRTLIVGNPRKVNVNRMHRHNYEQKRGVEELS